MAKNLLFLRVKTHYSLRLHHTLPNNNALESLNADLKTKLCLRRGISIERRKMLILPFYIA